MKTPKPNIKLFRRVIKAIKKYRKYYDPTTVGDLQPMKRLRKPECGTSGCFAGWTVALSGKRVGTQRMPLAAELLGISFVNYNDDGHQLFSAFNALRDMKRIIKRITNGKVDWDKVK